MNSPENSSVRRGSNELGNQLPTAVISTFNRGIIVGGRFATFDDDYATWKMLETLAVKAPRFVHRNTLLAYLGDDIWKRGTRRNFGIGEMALSIRSKVEVNPKDPKVLVSRGTAKNREYALRIRPVIVDKDLFTFVPGLRYR